MKTLIDWEIVSQRKDIEEIKCILNDTVNKKSSELKKSILSLIITVFGTIIATLLTSWLSSESIKISWYIYLIIAVFLILISLLPFYKNIYKTICRKEVFDSIIQEVNTFDNDTIYNVMLANKYCDLYENEENDTIEKNFYFSEAEYFIRKSIHQLTEISAVATCESINECGYGNKKRILKGRIEATLNFILFIMKRINDTCLNDSMKESISAIKITLRLENIIDTKNE